MAIEIRELLIRAVVAKGGATAGQQQGGGQQQSAPREEIVAECVEQVLDILRLKEER